MTLEKCKICQRLRETVHRTSSRCLVRPLEPFLLKLADLYLELHTKSTLLDWFNEEERVFWVAVGADGVPFGKDDSATG